MTTVLWFALLAINVFTFSLMGSDKARAKAGRWRIPERTLLLSAACFGALGGTLGMFYFRHKTRHWYFVVGMPLILAVQIAVAVWLSNGGAGFTFA